MMSTSKYYKLAVESAKIAIQHDRLLGILTMLVGEMELYYNDRGYIACPYCGSSSRSLVNHRSGCIYLEANRAIGEIKPIVDKTSVK